MNNKEKVNGERIMSKILYESHHPHIVITHDPDTGDVIMNRADKYVRNPDGVNPPFVPERIVLINTKEK